MVKKKVRNTVLGSNLKNDRMISVRFQGKPFNITVIQAYPPTSNAEEAEVEWFYEDLQDLESPNHQKHPVRDASYEQKTKQKHKPNHQQTGLPPHSAFLSEEKQTKTHNKFHPIQNLHKPLDQPYEGRNQKEERIQP